MTQIVKALLLFFTVGFVQAAWLGLMFVSAVLVTLFSFVGAGVSRLWEWIRWKR